MKKKRMSFWLVAYKCEQQSGNVFVSSRCENIDLGQCREYVRKTYNLAPTSGVTILGLFEISPETYRVEIKTISTREEGV